MPPETKISPVGRMTEQANLRCLPAAAPVRAAVFCQVGLADERSIFFVSVSPQIMTRGLYPSVGNSGKRTEEKSQLSS